MPAEPRLERARVEEPPDATCHATGRCGVPASKGARGGATECATVVVVRVVSVACEGRGRGLVAAHRGGLLWAVVVARGGLCLGLVVVDEDVRIVGVLVVLKVLELFV